ncbi:MAG: tol-pal system-associated acyl-CoA thioesterase [Gammaproteobacteria bacterium]
MSTFEFPVRVYYEDTDSGGVVYYANYLKFMERARTEWLRSLGFEQDALKEQTGVVFAVRALEVDYRRAARLDDALTVSATVESVGKASLGFEQEVKRGDELLVSARVRIACVDLQRFRPAAIPDEILSKISD